MTVIGVQGQVWVMAVTRGDVRYHSWPEMALPYPGFFIRKAREISDSFVRGRDVADWLGAKEGGVFNFHASPTLKRQYHFLTLKNITFWPTKATRFFYHKGSGDV